MTGQVFRRDTFAEAVGSTFVVDSESSSLELVLDRLEDGPSTPGFEQYALHFLGPADPLLAQRSFRLNHEEMGSLDIFLVPIGQVGGRIEYQACFNHRVASE